MPPNYCTLTIPGIRCASNFTLRHSHMIKSFGSTIGMTKKTQFQCWHIISISLCHWNFLIIYMSHPKIRHKEQTNSTEFWLKPPNQRPQTAPTQQRHLSYPVSANRANPAQRRADGRYIGMFFLMVGNEVNFLPFHHLDKVMNTLKTLKNFIILVIFQIEYSIFTGQQIEYESYIQYISF